MTMQFDYCKPKSLPEVLEILAREGPRARILAGGTDLLVNIQEKLESPELLVDIGELVELKRIEESEGYITIGALATHDKIANSVLLIDHAGHLVAACEDIGSMQIRTRGTIGGNLMTASPAGDTIPPLFTLGAMVYLESIQGRREVPIDDFFLGVKKTIARPDELVWGVNIRRMEEDSFAFWKKLGQRKALAISKVSIAGCIELSGAKVRRARIALGAVSPVVIRATQAEGVLEGRELSGTSIDEAAKVIVTESSAINDIRSTAEYRNEMTGVLLRRGLEEILGKIS